MSTRFQLLAGPITESNCLRLVACELWVTDDDTEFLIDSYNKLCQVFDRSMYAPNRQKILHQPIVEHTNLLAPM